MYGSKLENSNVSYGLKQNLILTIFLQPKEHVRKMNMHVEMVNVFQTDGSVTATGTVRMVVMNKDVVRSRHEFYTRHTRGHQQNGN